MTTAISRLLTVEEHRAMNEECISKGYWRNDRRIFTPGTAWSCPWLFDPTDPLDAPRRERKLEMIRNGTFSSSMLSRFYWEHWSDKRAPICLVCPNGSQWIIDQTANNGEGWVVTGEGLAITARPSIVVPGYHGWLTDGVFSDDLDGRGPNGVEQPITPRVLE